MIIVQLNGGLGNQMFQYAFARHLSIINSTDLKYDFISYSIDSKRDYALWCFNIDIEKANRQEIENFIGSKNPFISRIQRYLRIGINKNVLREKNMNFDKSNLSFGAKAYLIGYWQSEKYFKDKESVIRKEFQFKRKPVGKNKSMLKRIKSTDNVSIHIRRGDYVRDKKTNEFHDVTKMQFYKKAIELVSKIQDKPTFFVFSDDITWCKKSLNFIEDATFVDHNEQEESYEDMRLMSSCKHNIIANSSFSWWGAWLNDNPEKIVIAPKKWFNDPSISTRDRLPASWIKI